jgi:glycosyltransferase involved in cell wall biosynthesis
MVHYSDFHVDSRIQRQARALAERGDSVDLVCLSDDDLLRAGNGTIRLHQVHAEKAGGGAASYLSGYARFFAHALARVTRLDAKARFDIVEAHNMPDFLTFAAVLPKLRGTPLILNVHDTFPELFATKYGYDSKHPVVRLLRREEAISARLADAVITVTSEAADLLRDRGVGAGRTSVVMNSPDERLFGAQRPPVPLPGDGPLRALYHGGLAPRFGVELLIRAIASLGESLPRLSLRVCGTGSEHGKLIALAREVAPGRVDVAPRPVPLERIPAELERSQLGIVPTLRDGFTEHLLPVKLLEYVHMGLPAIAPRLPVIERYFGDGEVRFFEPGSEEGLAAAIAEVCADPQAAAARAERASARLEAIGWARQRREYLALVDGLVARTGDRGTVKVRGAARRSSSEAAAQSV